MHGMIAIFSVYDSLWWILCSSLNFKKHSTTTQMREGFL